MNRDQGITLMYKDQAITLIYVKIQPLPFWTKLQLFYSCTHKPLTSWKEVRQ